MIALHIWQMMGCLCAGVSGAVLSGAFQHVYQRRHRKALSRMRMHLERPKTGGNPQTAVLSFWERASTEYCARNVSRHAFYQVIFMNAARRWMNRWNRFMGMPALSEQGLSATCFMCGFAGLSAGLICGYALGIPILGVVVLCLTCFFAASRVPFRVGRAHIQQRREAMECELPQMLAMVSLGLRGGLSFDRSFALYAQEFDTDFARACSNAQNRWELSLISRDDGLRELGKSYDSPLFQQATESMIRSLRLGTALAENLDALAQEARNQYRSSCEEAIAKAPVKMLVPTGALILPSMLIFVMGPILLEMMGGF